MLKIYVSQDGRLYLHSILYDANQKYVANNSVKVFNDSNGVSTFNLTVYLKIDVESVLVSGSLSVKKRADREYSTFLRTAMDVCKLQSGAIGDLLYRIIADKIVQYSNYKLGCPIKKGHYYANMLPVPDIKLLPMFFLRNNVDFEVHLTGKAKFTRDTKRFVPYFTVKVYGSLEL